jgi:hypothetical protein
MSQIIEKLTAIWQEVCEVEVIFPEDNYFDLGGTSQKIIELHEKLQFDFPDKITIGDIFSYPTVGSMSEFLSEKLSLEAPDSNKLVDF